MIKRFKSIGIYLEQIINDTKLRNYLISQLAKLLIKLLWIVIMAGLLFPIYKCVNVVNSDCAIATVLPSLFINLPLSLLGLLVSVILSYILEILLNNSEYMFYLANIQPLLYWMIMLVIGYMQWFILLPFLWRKFTKINK